MKTIALLLSELFRSRLGWGILMGLGLIGLGVGFTLWSDVDARRFSAEAHGRVILLWDMGSIRGKSYMARFSYWGDGVPGTLEGTQDVQRDLYEKLKVSDLVPVYYIPQHPEEARIQKYSTRLGQLALLSLVVGMVVVLAMPVLLSGGGRLKMK